MFILINYGLGILIGMFLMKVLLESRTLYHLNTLSLSDSFDKLLEHGKSKRNK
jgi:hypothetical protein